MTTALQIFKEKSSAMITDVSIKTFGKVIKLEESLFEWQKQFKGDSEIMTVMQNNMDLINDWKSELRGFLAQSPLIKNSGI